MYVIYFVQGGETGIDYYSIKNAETCIKLFNGSWAPSESQWIVPGTVGVDD